MQKFFLVFFIFLSTMASAQTGVIMRGQTPDGKTNTYLQLSDEGLLRISGDVEIGDVSIESIPSYKDDVGDATRAIVDNSDRVIINIDSESNLLFDKLNEVIASIASETVLVNAIDTTDSITALQNPRILTVGVDEATIIGDIGTAKAVYIYTDNDLNFGGIELASGTGEPFIPGGAPFMKFNLSHPTPAFFMIGRTATATVRIWEAQ